MSSYKNILHWCNSNITCPSFEAMQNLIDFYHNKSFDMLKPGCTLPNSVYNYLHSSIDAKHYRSIDGDKDLMKSIRKDMAVGPSIVFTRKTVVYNTAFRKSTNLYKSIAGFDVDQLHPFSMRHIM